MSSAFPSVERRPLLTRQEFYGEYVEPGRPVILTGAISRWPALERWSPEYFRQQAGGMRVRVKDGYIARRRTMEMTLGEYLDVIEAHARGPEDAEPAPYLHDLPLLSAAPGLVGDAEPFPRELFPRMYRRRWWDFTQFFLAPRGSFTPLHFDCLETHNLFFQVQGSKHWILIDRRDAPYCYLHDWRWSEVNAAAPDHERHPLFRHARPTECTLGPGEVLYVPPGTLHQVRGLGVSISFNIDWHTAQSAVQGVLAARRGMPLTNVRYNLALAVGLCAGLPAEAVMPFYRSYLNYVS
ncbi:MAG: cupin-like domain-containing protein [Myxococcota bacterium]|nr:cupin-like domain-containing protein [Myxococcota bacterium]